MNVQKTNQKIDEYKIIEENFNQLVRRMGLSVKIIYTPDSKAKDHGYYDPENNLIMLFDKDPDKAYETLVHELLEYRLYPLIKKYRMLINMLIKYIDEKLNLEKELVFEDLVSDFKVLLEADMLPHPRNPRPKKSRARGVLENGGE